MVSRSLAARATVAVVTAAAAMTMAISMVMVRLFSVSHVFLVPVTGLRGMGVVRHASTWVTMSLPLAGMQRWLLVHMLP